MRIGAGDEFVRTTGGIITGPITISANAEPLITLDRPDAVANKHIALASGGAIKGYLTTWPAPDRLMAFSPTAAAVLDMTWATGLLGLGLIPLSMLARDQASGVSGIAITLLAADTDIVSVATAVNVAVGDRVLVYAKASTITKGATAGATKIAVGQSAGTATGVWINSAASLAATDNQIAAEVSERVLSSIYRITGAGSLTIKLVGSSAGSNATLAAGGGMLYLLTLRDSA